jgi:hypothetical protein
MQHASLFVWAAGSVDWKEDLGAWGRKNLENGVDKKQLIRAVRGDEHEPLIPIIVHILFVVILQTLPVARTLQILLYIHSLGFRGRRGFLLLP